MKTFLRKAFKSQETDIIIKKTLTERVLFIHFETLKKLLAAFICKCIEFISYFLL